MNWNISAMDCRVQEGQYQDVVITVHWQCTDTQEIDGKEYSGRVYSTCSLPAPEGSFIAYNDLTQDIVLGWIWANGVDQAATEVLASQSSGMPEPESAPLQPLPLQTDPLR